ncbi:MAG TPA: TetR/AcrR family transcriptional regulator C-terminal domain-containing protein [Acidimicrobiales bacterium]
MPRPRSLTTTGIAAAALAVVEGGGLAALSMRAVAAEMGVGTMSLYRYVRGREQLEDLVVDLVLAGVDTAVPPGDPWPARVATLAERARDAVGAHPGVVPLLLTRRHASEGTLRWGEAVVAALADAGFAGEARVIAFRTLMSYVLGAVQAEHLGPLSGPGTAAIASLPADRYPVLADTAAHGRGIAAADEFRRGLAVVLRGLGAVQDGD